MAVICPINELIFVIASMVVCISLACTNMLSMVFCVYERFISWKVPLMLICAGIVLNFKGLPSGRVIDCTLPMPGTFVTALVILSITRKSAELRRSLSVSTSNISGFIRETGKCRSAAANPSCEGRSAGRYLRSL